MKLLELLRKQREIYLFAFFLASVLLLLGIVYRYIGGVTAIKGSYALIGVVLAALLYRGERASNVGESDHEVESVNEFNRLSRYGTKSVLIVVLSAYIVTYVTGERAGSTIAALLFGYSLVGIQLMYSEENIAIVPQIVALFSINPVTKYLSTGFYFGETDLLGHVRGIELFAQTGQIEQIGAAYTTYGDFPALHIVSASIGSFAGLPAYDSLLILGVIMYCSTVVGVYHICRLLFTSTQSVAITFIFASLSPVYYYSSYFFPQAFATALLILFFYVLIRMERSKQSARPLLSLTAILIISALTFAHHVTQIILIMLVVGLYLPSALKYTTFGQNLRINENVPQLTPVLLAITAGTTHLVLSSGSTVSYFLRFTANKLGDSTVSDTGGQRVVFGMGTEIPYHTPRVAVESLIYVDGIYYIGLLALFVAGVVVISSSYKRFIKTSGFLLLGGISSLAVLRTPFINTLSRLTLPFGFFFSLVGGIGLWHLLTSNGHTDRKKTRIWPSTRQVCILGLVVMIGVTGPLVAADDLYGLHAGPNLWETYSTPEQQVDFSDQEMDELESMIYYTNNYSSDTSMLWVSQAASGRFGKENNLGPTSVSEEGIQASSSLVYRTKWTEHQVGYSTDQLGTIAIADWWLNREIEATNKVYTTGMTGVVWEKDSIELSNNRTTG